MQKRTTVAAESAHNRQTPGGDKGCAEAAVGDAVSLDQQSLQLVGYLDTLFRRLLLNRKQADDPHLEISREEFRALIFLDSGDSVTMSSLADSLGVPLSTATHTMDRLVAKGLAERNRGIEDRRVVKVQISAAGQKMQDSIRDQRRSVARSWLEPLAPEERETYLALMAKITLLAKPEEPSR